MSAFDRCLRQICELYKDGMEDDAINVIDIGLANRSTIYEWNKELLGPALNMTCWEQGGFSSCDVYKQYNNEQLKTA